MREPTLLIVDDEDGVIEAIRQTLEAGPYRVLATTDPCRALEMVKGGEIIDLMIIDLFMPGMDGATLLKECRRIRPELRFVLSSGIASEAELRRWRGRGETVIAKPWRDEQFKDVIQKTLRRGSPAALVE